MALTVAVKPTGICVEVGDECGNPPVVHHTDSLSGDGGWAMRVVSGLSDSWSAVPRRGQDRQVLVSLRTLAPVRTDFKPWLTTVEDPVLWWSSPRREVTLAPGRGARIAPGQGTARGLGGVAVRPLVAGPASGPWPGAIPHRAGHRPNPPGALSSAASGEGFRPAPRPLSNPRVQEPGSPDGPPKTAGPDGAWPGFFPR